ncbi:ABC transporter permease subunit [Candidatus Berkiella cookevillensis]|uniref:ABC transporter permease subunit n=1 Tax=Candidatus Berkiella cookevillensis TaxID=437022 RepID=A0A0Q9YFA5_9GAMM|nr:ABC transporter permease subunit [Candidatus Berkiella cookevillensis]MCS5708862.1 ABC transporter permease subunit [Candidatus Berkiella cookevillensis]
MSKTSLYAQPKHKTSFVLNQWDLFILLIVFGVFAALVWGAQQMVTPYQLGESIQVSLSPSMLPQYAIRTVIRMAIALSFSLLFTFTIGTLAAKSRRAEMFIIPFIDIMQSVPILGFLSISILGFIYLFPSSQLGPECAAIFVIFTSQVWNMALSFYQSLKTIPKELNEASSMFHLSAWQRFWRLEVPFATPSLIWNTMMSLSAGWFFVVASEAISVNNQKIMLPGIGSYIMLASKESNYAAICYVILTMFLVILIYDQLIFRPLISWSEKFKLEPNLDMESNSTWFLNILQRAHITHQFVRLMNRCRDLITIPKFKRNITSTERIPVKVKQALSWTAITFWNCLLLLSLLACAFFLIRFIYTELSLTEVLEVFELGFITTIKVFILIVLCSLIWVPIGVWIGLNPRIAQAVQPLVQFLASFPANLVYPVLFMLIVTYKLNVNIWTAPLMILGTQWYILFNVVAGTMQLPLELRLAAKNYGVKGWLWWRKVILPGIFPYYVTGAMTAAGGCWNASIVADVVEWQQTTLHATGIGAYITEFTTVGDFPRIALGISVMCIYVIVINRLVWRKLYELSEERYGHST